MKTEDVKDQYIRLSNDINLEFLTTELDWICEKLLSNIKRFEDHFPSACTIDGKYRIKGNDDWTNGFWTGMLWMAYLHTGKEDFRRVARANVQSFNERLEAHFILDHHDIGFLYSLSVVAAYEIEQEDILTPMILKAADKLIARFQSAGEFIQAWGPLGLESEYRLIIDSLLNLPLLYKASELSGNEIYEKIANLHYHQVVNNIFREDFSTYHTYYFDKTTGQPKNGATHQGFSDQSCWARGQAWAVLGIPLRARITGILDNQDTYVKATDYFLSKLPQDLVPYWDLAFDDDSNQPKDSSALAIAACGMIEASKVGYYTNANQIAKGMIDSLAKQYTSKHVQEEEGILLHGVYAFAEGKGIDESNLWGDYFYMEAIYRLLYPDFKTFW